MKALPRIRTITVQQGNNTMQFACIDRQRHVRVDGGSSHDMTECPGEKCPGPEFPHAEVKTQSIFEVSRYAHEKIGFDLTLPGELAFMYVPPSGWEPARYTHPTPYELGREVPLHHLVNGYLIWRGRVVVVRDWAGRNLMKISMNGFRSLETEVLGPASDRKVRKRAKQELSKSRPPSSSLPLELLMLLPELEERRTTLLQENQTPEVARALERLWCGYYNLIEEICAQMKHQRQLEADARAMNRTDGASAVARGAERYMDEVSRVLEAEQLRRNS